MLHWFCSIYKYGVPIQITRVIAIMYCVFQLKQKMKLLPLLLLVLLSLPSFTHALTYTSCTTYGILSTTQACIGEQRLWTMTGDDQFSRPANTLIVNVTGSTVDFVATAPIPSPGSGGVLLDFDKFYIVTENLFNQPPFRRGDFFNEVIGPFNYGLPPSGNTVQLGSKELGRIAAMKTIGSGKLYLIEEQSGCVFVGGTCTGRNGAGTEGFAAIDFAGALPPPLPPVPTPVSGTSGENNGFSGEASDPINTFTGELFKSFPPDIDLGGPMPLRFSRYYASGLAADHITGAMAPNWRHNFEWSLTTNATAAGGTASIVDVISNKGRLIRFSKAGTVWQLSGRKDIPYQLVEDTIAATFTLLDPRNNRMHIFNNAGQLIAIQDHAGNKHSLTYDAAGLLTQVSDGLGRVLTFTYDGSNKVQVVDGGNGQQIGFVYSLNNGVSDNLVKVIDALNLGVLGGKATLYGYSTVGNLLTSITKPQGNITFTQTWNANNQVATQTDGLGNTTTLTYSGSDTTITDPLARAMIHTHTTTGELSGVTRRDGTSISLASNAVGQRNGITDSLGANTSYTYDTASGRVATTTHANGAATIKSFVTRTLASGVKQFDLASITHADSTVETFDRDTYGNLISYVDRRGNTTSFTHNANGQWLTRTNPLGGSVVRTFNADATLATSIDESGNATSFTYDLFKRLSTMNFADGSTQSFTYDLLNRPLTITDNRGNVSSFVWDANSNMTSSTDRVGTTTAFSYNAMDMLTTITDVNGATMTRGYDALLRLSSITDRNGNTTSFGYDTQNRLTKVTDGNGNIWQRSFDSEGIIASSISPLGNTTSYTSDNMGRITKVTSPLGNSVQMRYDVMGRITQITDPLGYIQSNSYDVYGQLSGKTLPGAITASYTHNALGQIDQVTDPYGNQWQRIFDTAGRLTGSKDPLLRLTSFSYDNRNRVQTITFPGGLGTRTNTYDANGNLTQRSFSDGTTINFTYDAEDRLLTANGLNLARDNLGRITNSNGIAIAHDAGGRITSITYAAGKSVSYTYDANNHVTSITDWLGGVSSFTYDADNRLVSMVRPNGVTTTYTYDNDGRLIDIQVGTLGSIALTRDAKGQITVATRTLPTATSAGAMTSSSHSFDAAAQVSSTGFSYDAMGRLTNDGVATFTWDLASRLTSVGTTTHTYDGIGYRLSRTTAMGTRNYVWNLALGLPSVSIEKQGATDLRYYVHTPDGALLYSIDAATPNTRHFYHFDETGNTRFVTDDAGAVQVSYAYSPFGVLQATTGALDNPFTWQGQGGVFDDGNGLYYVRARYYDANIGRFISKDPVKSIAPKKINPYQYALNNPLIFGDISGSDVVSIVNKPGAGGDPRAQLAAILARAFGRPIESVLCPEPEDPNDLRLDPIVVAMEQEMRYEDIDIWDTDEGEIPESESPIGSFFGDNTVSGYLTDPSGWGSVSYCTMNLKPKNLDLINTETSFVLNFSEPVSTSTLEDNLFDESSVRDASCKFQPTEPDDATSPEDECRGFPSWYIPDSGAYRKDLNDPMLVGIFDFMEP